MYTGIAASQGIAIGTVYLVQEEAFLFAKDTAIEQIAQEIDRFVRAIDKSRAELEEIQAKAMVKLGAEEAGIFEAHLAILDDPEMRRQVIDKIKDQKTAEWAVMETMNDYADLLQKAEDEYLSERAQDIRDIGKRILNNLQGKKAGPFWETEVPVVLVAQELTPSETAQLNKEKILGIATDMGGRTSHTAIMARAMEIPAVVGLKDITKKARHGDTIILDGTKGWVVVNPEPQVQSKYAGLKEELSKQKETMLQTKDLAAETTDGQRVLLLANIGVPPETGPALEYGAEGIGLFRTEFLFMDRETMPGEEEQFLAYKSVLQALGDKPVIIRTMDIGGDKEIPYLGLPKEMNPFLGVRAIRLCLARPELFRTQLRAILRASCYGQAWIMYPMIALVEEVKRANEILAETKQELEREGIAYNPGIKAGMMVEIPAAAIMAEAFAPHVDFFSIGTNDLIQYTLAADRINEELAYLYDPFHPAVLHLIKNVLDTGHKYHKVVGMCGEMAGDPEASLILLGMGLQEFSMSPSSIPYVKKIIRNATFSEAKEIMRKALALPDSRLIKDYLISETQKYLHKGSGNAV